MAKRTAARKTMAKRSAKKSDAKKSSKPSAASGRARSPTKAKAKKASAAKAKKASAATPSKAHAKASKRDAKPSKAGAKPSKAGAKPSKAGAARGLALVEQVIARIERDGGVLGGCGIPSHAASGLPADQLAALTLPDGRPLPPSLQRFLAYDATYLGVLEGNPPRLAFRTFGEMMKHEFDERTAEIFDFGQLLPGQCLVVPGGSDSRRFMYVGEPDEHGEYPVFVVDTDDVPFVCLAYPGLDVYLADGVTAKVIEGTYTDGFAHPIYGPMLEQQARRNFGGLVSFDMGGGDTEHLDGEEGVQAIWAQMGGDAGIDPTTGEPV